MLRIALDLDSTIVDFDNIIVFKEGQILANGTFNDLLSNNKYFNELYNRDKFNIEKEV